MNILQGQFLPHFYHYSSLQIYLVTFANTFAYLFGGAAIPNLAVTAHPEQFAQFYLIGRILSAIMGAGTVAAIYGVGKTLWNRRTGLAAAALLAIAPLHAQHSHWLTVDVPGTFWATLALLFAARLAKSEIFSWRNVLWSAIFAGLAAATKYNLALALLPLFAALWQRSASQRPQTFSRALAAIGACALAFLVGCPGSILEMGSVQQDGTFLHDVSFEARHVSQEPGDTFTNTGSGFIYHIVTNLGAGLGWPLLLAVIASLVWAARRRSQGDGLLAAFAIPYYIVIGLAAVRYARYVLPLLPVLCLWTGRVIADISESAAISYRRINLACALIIGALTLGWAIVLLKPMSTTDPRDLAEGWLQDHANITHSIAFPTMPWFQTAPVSPYFSAPQRSAWRRLQVPTGGHRVWYEDKDWDTGLLNREHIPAVVVSQYDTQDALRLHNMDAAQYFGVLRSDYRLGAQFGGYRPFGTGLLTMPHDMLYANPNISIYIRR